MDSRFAFEVGCTLCLQISVVIAVTFALQRWIGDARFGCRLWTTCFVCVIGLVAAAILLPHRRLFSFPGELSRESTLNVVVWQSRLAMGLGIFWASGVVVSLVRRALLCGSLLRFLKFNCKAMDAGTLLGRVGIKPCEQSNLSILEAPQIQGPFCWQFQRPVIVLPTFLIKEDDATLRHVLLHELEHLRTQHPMQHFLQGVCSTLFWFHPLVWSAARGAELTREYLCDEVAAKTAGKFGAYLRTLAKVAERCGSVSCTGVPKGTLAFGNHESALVQRSKRLVELAEGRLKSPRWRPVFAIAGLFLVTALIQQVWLPTNAMASQRSEWSPWPKWSASVLHLFNVPVRDFEQFEDRVQMHELVYEDN
ncbi:M56 family metallopeptidase [Rhodopirellula sp. JC740]|uniref:M56 family metallopeptidase n=1 Tax=Rhodopirellula halodulae TaxID=2894198 RepID=A0ABS8NQH4_9BACT|nr:M56 family metallopeptidase [Rhodopirellula sp. JC740]